MSSDPIREEIVSGGKGSNMSGIGSLEAVILSVLWDNDGKGTVRLVYEVLREQRIIAYTTVMTVMNNLTKKGLLHQDKSKLAYSYTTVKPRNQLGYEVVSTDLKKLCGQNKGAMESILMRALQDLRAS
jgi:predicted transcriptional regulator